MDNTAKKRKLVQLTIEEKLEVGEMTKKNVPKPVLIGNSA